MKVTIEVLRQAGGWGRQIKDPSAWAKKTSRFVLQPMRGRQAAELSVVLSNDVHIRALNHDFRGKDTPTNVLSFPSGDDGAMLGDIILAYDTIAREAKAQGKTFRDHATHLLIHGILHLLGYDHMEAQEAGRMENMEIQLLKKLGIANPY